MEGKVYFPNMLKINKITHKIMIIKIDMEVGNGEMERWRGSRKCYR